MASPAKTPTAATPTARRLRSPERRETIVAAVVTLCAELGPDAITTQSIADRIGTTQGALFRHFPDKEAIWAAVFDWVRQALGEAVGAAFRAGHDPLDTIERVFYAHVAFAADHPGVPRIVFHELQRSADSPARRRLRELVGGYRQRLSGLFDAARAARQVRPSLDSEAAAVLFIGTVQGLVLQAALFAGEDSITDKAKRIFPLLLDGFRDLPPKPAPGSTPRRASRSRTRLMEN